MDVELRIYTLKEGRLREFVGAWRDEVLPLRLRCGFRVLGAYHTADERQFVWQLTHGHRDGVEAAEAAYAQTRAGVTFTDDPARHVEQVEVRFLRAVSLTP